MTEGQVPPPKLLQPDAQTQILQLYGVGLISKEFACEWLGLPVPPADRITG